LNCSDTEHGGNSKNTKNFCEEGRLSSSGSYLVVGRNPNPKEDQGCVQCVEQKDCGIWCVMNVKSAPRDWNAKSREQGRR